jgi:replication initiation protein RepC
MIKSSDLPERHIIVEMLRNAAPRLGLSAPVVSTLDAMLSCLAPKRTHHTVFASNATLTFRRNGISERTIRRHVAVLQTVGLIIRNDSPNKKRYTRHSAVEGKAIRFGFDLTPLFEQLQSIARLAAEALEEREQIAFLKAKIRSAANSVLNTTPSNELALGTLRALRRNLTVDECHSILRAFQVDTIQAETNADLPHTSQVQISPINSEDGTGENHLTTTQTSANNGQNVRHYHKSNKEHIDKEETSSQNPHVLKPQPTNLSVPELLSVCTEAKSYALNSIRTIQDVILHARTLAPMIGIDDGAYYAAQDRIGRFETAATVWAIMQFHDGIRHVGAYFRSITTGAKSNNFNISKLIHRLALKQGYAHETA